MAVNSKRCLTQHGGWSMSRVWYGPAQCRMWLWSCWETSTAAMNGLARIWREMVALWSCCSWCTTVPGWMTRTSSNGHSVLLRMSFLVSLHTHLFNSVTWAMSTSFYIVIEYFSDDSLTFFFKMMSLQIPVISYDSTKCSTDHLQQTLPLQFLRNCLQKFLQRNSHASAEALWPGKRMHHCCKGKVSDEYWNQVLLLERLCCQNDVAYLQMFFSFSKDVYFCCTRTLQIGKMCIVLQWMLRHFQLLLWSPV